MTSASDNFGAILILGRHITSSGWGLQLIINPRGTVQ